MMATLYGKEARSHTIRERADILFNEYTEPREHENGLTCLTWTRPLLDTGYGQVGFQRKRWNAHRFFYTAFKGEIPEGITVHHVCGNGRKGCVDPDHLQLSTCTDNLAEMHARHSYERHIAWLEGQLEAAEHTIRTLATMLGSK